MSSISMDIPTLKINSYDLENLIKFIYSHEELLKQYGALKFQLDVDCELGLKKRNVFVILDTNQQIIKTDSNERIYSYKSKTNQIKSNEKLPLSSTIKNENLFWSKLSRRNNNHHSSNVSILYNRSFFNQRSSRQYFSMYDLPKKSLLKLGGSQLLNQINPYLMKSHGPGANVPLNYTQKHLSSLIYHHCGGARHWYIVPHSEKENLEQLMINENLPVCLNHNQLLIDPEVFDKHGIRYHKIIQYVTEIVILSAGSLSQSFFEDASWNESIDFALPSWIEDEHAFASCQCVNTDQTISYEINLELFQPERIQKYVNTHLKVLPRQQQQVLTNEEADENNSLSMDGQSNDGNNSPNIEGYSLPDDHPVIFDKTESRSDTSSSPISNSSYGQHQQRMNTEGDNEQQMNIENINQQKLLKEKKMLTVSTNQSNNSPIYSPHRLSVNGSNNLSTYSPDGLSVNGSKNLSTYSPDGLSVNGSNDLLEYSPDRSSVNESNDLLESSPDQLSLNGSKNLSTHSPDRSSVNGSKNVSADVANKNNEKKATLNARKTLFVSGLKKDVNKKILYRYFVGCVKVTIKTCRSKPGFKYAFIVHRTYQASAANLIRPINHQILGPECFIEYANNNKEKSTVSGQYTSKTLVIRKIPGNVTVNDFKTLFGNCHVVKYGPARYTEKDSQTRFSLGYAFIYYATAEETEAVMKNADQYTINGSSLSIAYFRKNQHYDYN